MQVGSIAPDPWDFTPIERDTLVQSLRRESIELKRGSAWPQIPTGAWCLAVVIGVRFVVGRSSAFDLLSIVFLFLFFPVCVLVAVLQYYRMLGSSPACAEPWLMLQVPGCSLEHWKKQKKKIATETIVPRAGGAENGALNTVFLTRNGGRASPGLHKLFGS